MLQNLKIGLFGFGCVGEALFHVLENTNGIKTEIVKIGVKNKTKPRILDNSFFTFNKYEILDDPEINLIIELIDDAQEAYNIVSYALSKGKHVITANKKMLANNLNDLLSLERNNNVTLLYEASACGSIPIVRSIGEYFGNEHIDNIAGIFNGTTNYILTKTILEGISYEKALLQAQEKGFAETDPTSDVEGYDPKYKAIILALHSYGHIVSYDDVLNIGITTINNEDLGFAKEKGLKVKLVATIKKVDEKHICVFVLPKFINEDDNLYNVDNEFNAVNVVGEYSGEQFFKGRGAGGYPTCAAVLSDIAALNNGYKYEYKKHHAPLKVGFTNDVLVKVYYRYNVNEDLERLDFKEITQKYSSSLYNYVIGYTSLKNLKDNRDFLLKNGLFVALI